MDITGRGGEPTTGSPTVDRIAENVAQLAARWVIEGRYPLHRLDLAIDDATRVFTIALRALAPQVIEVAVAEYDAARKAS